MFLMMITRKENSEFFINFLSENKFNILLKIPENFMVSLFRVVVCTYKLTNVKRILKLNLNYFAILTSFIQEQIAYKECNIFILDYTHLNVTFSLSLFIN